MSGDPLDQLQWVAGLDGRRQGDEPEDRERVGAPHQPDHRRDEDGDPTVQSDMLVGSLRLACLLALGNARIRHVLDWPRTLAALEAMAPVLELLDAD